MNVFQKNYDILLGIFNPEGWLEISYPWILSVSVSVILYIYFTLVNVKISKRKKKKEAVVILWFKIVRYVDETIRIGRDDKGNIFILERLEQEA